MIRINFTLVLLFGILSAGLLLESCNKNDNVEPFNDSGRTALDYAQECEDIFGPFPRFSCEDAILVPARKNGVPITNESWDPNDCDCPMAFGKPCETDYRVGRYIGLNSDGTENPDLVWFTNCRNGGPGVIGYKFTTGQICMFNTVTYVTIT